MAEYDTVIRGGMVVDGTRLPRFRADIGIRDGVIAEIGRIDPAAGERVIDADGLVVAPGFIDIHTHYDGQIFGDPYCTLSGWHGVTSVVIGNCGFGFAPIGPDQRERSMRTMTRVEAIPYDVLDAWLPWTWESFPEFLDAIEATPKGVNLLPYVPVGPMIGYVIGFDEAKTRHATPEENQRIAELFDIALQAGGCGWSAQRTPPDTPGSSQRDYDGTSFVTDVMSDETVFALCDVLARRQRGFIQYTYNTGDPFADAAHVEKVAEISGRPVIYNAVTTDERAPFVHRSQLEWLASCRERGLPVYGQGVTTDAGFTFTFENWNMWDESPTWRDATLGTPEERLVKFKDPARRQGLKDHPPLLFPIERLTLVGAQTEAYKQYENQRIEDSAASVGKDVVDFLVEMIVDESLKTKFWIPQANTSKELQNELVEDPYLILGTSDGGAHLKFITTARYTTEAIEEFVRARELLSLEDIHWRLSALPARCAGFENRGTLVRGAPADIVVYDYERLHCLPEEVAHDLPAGEWRRIQRAEGYEYVLVNGEVTVEHDEFTGATPGRLLRFGG